MYLCERFSFEIKVKKADDEPKSSKFRKLANVPRRKNNLPVSCGPNSLAMIKEVKAPNPAFRKLVTKLKINLFLYSKFLR